MTSPLRRGLPARHYVDRNGVYLGAFAGVRVPVRVKTATRPVVEKRIKTRAAGTRAAIERGPDGKAVRRMVPVEEAVTRAEPLYDEAGAAILDAKGAPVMAEMPVIEEVQVGVEDVFEDREIEEGPALPVGAVEVPTPPPAAAARWDFTAGRWTAG